VTLLKKKLIKFGDLNSVYPALPAALGAESSRNTAEGSHNERSRTTSSLAVNSSSELRVGSLPSLGFEPAIFSMLTHLSDRQPTYVDGNSVCWLVIGY
jgi:hypothetical protein